jgi:hypothetical protein
MGMNLFRKQLPVFFESILIFPPFKIQQPARLAGFATGSLVVTPAICAGKATRINNHQVIASNFGRQLCNLWCRISAIAIYLSYISPPEPFLTF